MDDAPADRAAPVPPDPGPPAAAARASWWLRAGPRTRAAALGSLGDGPAWAALGRYLDGPRPV
jgi:hypothetical protein